MKKLQELVLLSLVVLFLQVLALLVVFRSLVGGKTSVNDHSTSDSLGISWNLSVKEHRAEKVDKVVLVIIDAMRYDFIEEMKFLKESLDSGDCACLFKVSLEGPTVTLPRIKTLVTGTTSSYWDFLNNLKTTAALTVDNILWKAKKNGKNVVFYGDDTWLTLFPQDVFLRSEGVTSFFVTDFYEVDNNVTKNVEAELSNGSQFDMMILHYLGVDHVGHVHGPTHSLIPEKLEEMDGIIQKIFVELQSLGQIGDLPNVMFITGDHGMANKGGHGGDSPQEITTPMVLLTAHKGAKGPSLCEKNSPGWTSAGFSMNQVDFASIISFFWDLPCPDQAKGHVPAEVLSLYPQYEQLRHVQITCKRLIAFMPEGSNKKTAESLLMEYERELAVHISGLGNQTSILIGKFETLRTYIKANVVENVQQDVYGMVGATVVIMLSLVFYEVSVRRSGMKIFFTASGRVTLEDALGILSILAIFIACLVWTGIIWTFGFVASALLCIFITRNLPTLVTIALPKETSLFSSLVCIHFGTTFLYFSSSFVEEEHFLLHYVYTTVIVVSLVGTTTQFRSKKVLQSMLLIAIHRVCGSLNSTGQKWNSVMDVNDMLTATHLKNVACILAIVILIWLRLRTVIELMISAGILLVKTDLLSAFTILISGYNHSVVQLLYALIVVNVPTENVILVPLVIFQVRLIQVSNTCRPWWTTGIMLNSLFLTSFFYQGNSNSITTIDIAMGYIGLSSYNEYIVGLLTFLGTFSCPILVMLTIASAQTQKLCNGRLFRTDGMTLKYFLRIHTLRLSAANLVFSVVVISMRQHLFIWSVFVPKLMYQIAFTFLSFLLLSHLLCRFHSVQSEII